MRRIPTIATIVALGLVGPLGSATAIAQTPQQAGDAAVEQCKKDNPVVEALGGGYCLGVGQIEYNRVKREQDAAKLAFAKNPPSTVTQQECTDNGGRRIYYANQDGSDYCFFDATEVRRDFSG